LILDSNGEQVWSGEESSELTAMSDALSAIADANREAVAGVALCSARDGATVFVAQPSEALSAEIAAVAGAHPSLTVATQDVAAGAGAVMNAGFTLKEEADYGPSITMIGVDVYTGGLIIAIDPAVDLAVAGESIAESIHARVVEVAGVDLPIAVEFDGADVDATRQADSAPWWMGSELRYTSGGETHFCSTGVPIKTGGVTRLLTAGHCNGSTFTNNGTQVGTLFTTAWNTDNNLTNSDIYGDWRLIGGSTYAKRVWNGPLTGPLSTATMAITSANWGTRPAGTALCTSGRSTGQVCRCFVTIAETMVNVGGVDTYPVNRMRHDSNNGSASDTNGFSGGDSGGPCYYADGNGGVIANGIVTSHNPTRSRYSCTLLEGVRNWNSGAVLG
jgi:hypothetical protein